MRNPVTTIVGIAAVALALWLTTRDFHAPKAIGHDPNPKSAVDGGTDGANLLFAYADAGAAGDDAGPAVVGERSDLAPHPSLDGGLGPFLADGTQVPVLPFAAPRQVRFGVVLVTFAGVQPSVGGGHPSKRSRAEAKELATKLAQAAEQDFHAAVQQGDPGSSEDVGRVRTGILEPAPEYLLFSLPVDGVGGPVETPRGYWVVKRLE